MILIALDVIGALAGLFLLILLGQHLRLAWRSRLHEIPALSTGQQTNFPQILVQIPFYNEAASVEDALAGAAMLDWPSGKLTIQLLDDSTDETSALAAAAIARLPPGAPTVEHLRRSHRGGFKAGALAEGLARSDALLIAILDADFRPPPEWLRLAAAALLGDDTAAFAQFRFEFANRERNWMTRGQQLLVDTHFYAEQAGRAANGDPFQFNGTGALWRRTAIKAAGGWSSDTLAEDLDLTFRAYGAGWHGILVLDPPLRCEAPDDLVAWRVQQARWSTGFVQVAQKVLPLIWRSAWPLSAKLGSTLLLGVQAGLPCFLVSVAAFVTDALARGFGAVHFAILLASLVLAASCAVAITWPPFRRLRRGGIIRYAATLMSVPALLVFLAAANSAGVLAAPFAVRHEFARTPKTGGK